MNEIAGMYYALKLQLNMKEQELLYVSRLLDEIGREQRSIVVKSINNNQYYYEQWRQDGKNRYRSLGKVRPGSAAIKEREILQRKELLEKESDLKFIIEQLQTTIKQFENKENNISIISEYSFEVFWKDELSARVSVTKNRVHVSRFINHPLRQIFSGDIITRNQLNEVLKLRCFEEERPDCRAKLNVLGLTEYNPLEIVKKTHGVSYNDYIWFRFPGEIIKASDVLVRSYNV